MGQATPHTVRRRVHPAAVAGDTPHEPVRTGIDYLGLLDAEHTAATRRRINYTDLPHNHDHDHTDARPGGWHQPPLPFTGHDNTGHDNTGHDNTGHDNTGHDQAVSG